MKKKILPWIMTKMNCSIQIALNTKASCYEKLPLLLKIVILMMNLNILYDFNIILSFILTLLIFQKETIKIKTIYYILQESISFD